MASDCSGAPKRLVEELGGTSAGEALRARFPELVADQSLSRFPGELDGLEIE